MQRLDEHEATIKSQEVRLKSQEAKLKRQEAELETQESCLAEEVTCMVCLDLPGPGKVPVCVNGHIICQICIRLVTQGNPSCNHPGAAMRARLLVEGKNSIRKNFIILLSRYSGLKWSTRGLVKIVDRSRDHFK